MSKSNQITAVIAIALVVLSFSVVYQMTQPITAQNVTGNETTNQTGGLDLVPPRMIEEETQEEIVAGQQ